MTNEYESVRDEIKNEVILEMRNHIDSTAITILGQVLNKVLLSMSRTPVTLVIGWIDVQSEIKREVYIRKWGEVSGKGL